MIIKPSPQSLGRSCKVIRKGMRMIEVMYIPTGEITKFYGAPLKRLMSKL